jgi:hypothetical protein
MSTLPDQPEPTPGPQNASASEIEALAEDFIALVEEFEATMSEGRVPPEFEERLAHVHQIAERLIGP